MDLFFFSPNFSGILYGTKIVTTSNPEALETALANLTSHVTEPRWREVFLLTVGMLEPADRLLLLMKREIDTLIAKNLDLQRLLVWAKNRSNSVEADYKIAAIRSLYLYFHDLDLSRAIEKSENLELKQVLKELQQQLPDHNKDIEPKTQWWKDNGKSWREELRKATIKYRKIGYNWEFSREQINLFHQYLTANQLLVNCLNSECYVSREVREEIENTLLLPYADLNYD